MMTVDIGESVLSRIPLLRNLNETELHQVVDVMRVRHFAPGDCIIRQGDECRNLWVLLEGQCEVICHPEHQAGKLGEESVILAVLEPYTHFGEMSFFHAAPHSADVRARSAVKLLQLVHSDFADMIDDGIWAAFKLSHNVVQEMAERLRRMNDRFTELAVHPANEKSESEWSTFRDKLFGGWTV